MLWNLEEFERQKGRRTIISRGKDRQMLDRHEIHSFPIKLSGATWLRLTPSVSTSPWQLWTEFHSLCPSSNPVRPRCYIKPSIRTHRVLWFFF
jgi:hypothetical protein